MGGRGSRAGPIWLVGMMGSGKSSVGPRLARRLGRAFLDADRRIEEVAGRSIPEIFEAEGEAGFRALERRIVEEAAAGDAVVALGGGAIAQPGAAERLAETGTVVYLKAGVDALLARVGSARTRPLLAGLDPDARRARIEQMLAEREPAYRTAAVVVETDGMSVEAVAEELAGRLAPVGEAGR